MTSTPDSYVDSMPCDPDLLVELGRVTWAAARLHAVVRDAINRLDGAPSDAPFETTLGAAIAMLEGKAKAANRHDIAQWVVDHGRPAKDERNKVIHAVGFTADDGRQAIRTADHSLPGRYLNPDLREVTRLLIEASALLPSKVSGLQEVDRTGQVLQHDLT